MQSISTEIKTHRLIFKSNFDEKPILLAAAEKQHVIALWKSKTACIEIGELCFSWLDIAKIAPISREEISRKFSAKNFPTKEELNREFQEKFSLDCIEYLEMTPEKRKEFAAKKPCQAFQFEFYEKNLNSTLREQNKAFANFVVVNFCEKNPTLKKTKIATIFRNFSGGK